MEYAYSDELQHYGVLGLKWGVRRARKALSKATTQEQRDKALSNLDKHRTKSTDKLAKLSKQSDKLKKQRQKDVEVNEYKVAQMQARAAHLKRKSKSILNTDVSAYSRSRKADKLNDRAARLNQRIERTKSQIVKNAKMQKTFKQGINDIDKLLIENGRKIIEG